MNIAFRLWGGPWPVQPSQDCVQLPTVFAQNQRRTQRRLTLPVLGIGGADGIGEGAANTMKLAADDVQSLVIPGSGHYCLRRLPRRCWPR